MPEKKESALLLLTRAWARVRSSFGKVYKALHHASNLIMAVKIVPLEDDNGDVAREIEHLQECDCPNVVRYHGSFVHEDRLWILMEFCEGSSLLDIMAATGRCLTEMQVAAALSGCVEALLYLHARSKVHRDVKAGNLLLSSDGVVKLADFGVAASIENSSRRKTVIGTPFWMAPEVITCRRGPGGGSSAGYDQLADVWSLGITAIELAEGQPPHSSVSPLTAIFLIPTKPAPSLTEPEHWSAAFAQFVSACLVKEPQGRADSPSLHRHPFIIGGGRAVKDGVLRALMAASREPLRAFRDKSAAKNAAGPRAHAAAADGTVKDLKEIGDHQYGGTLNPSSPNRRGGVEPPRDSKRSSFGDRAGREPPGPNGSFTLPRACNSPQARRADAERLSNGDRDRAPPSPLASACWGAGDGRTEASKIDFEAIQSVARLLSGGGGGGGGGLHGAGTLPSALDGDARLQPAAPPAPSTRRASSANARPQSQRPPNSAPGAPHHRRNSDASPVDVSDGFGRARPSGSGTMVVNANGTLKSSTMMGCDPGTMLVNSSGTIAIKDAKEGPNPLAAALRSAAAYNDFDAIGGSSSSNGAHAQHQQTPAADATMVVHTGHDASGESSTMVIKPEAAKSLLRHSGRERADSSGTMLLAPTPHAGGGGLDDQPAFMRHMFGPPGDGHNANPNANAGGDAGARARRTSLSHDEITPQGAPNLNKEWSNEDDSSRRESGGRAGLPAPLSDRTSPSSAAKGAGGDGGRPRVSISSTRGDFAAMGIETLNHELATLSTHMERDIGKVYRKYERLERTIRAERDRKIADKDRQTALHISQTM